MTNGHASPLILLATQVAQVELNGTLIEAKKLLPPAQQRLPASRPEGPSQLVRERPTPRQPAAQNLDG